jgi:NitT/TauT family transport system substrate-binding protein
MTIRRVRGLGLLIMAAALMLAAGCSSAGSTAGPGGPAGSGRVEKPDLTVAVVPALDSAGFFIALHQGLFTAQGLHVRFVPAISSETAINDQVKGLYDITAGNYVSYIEAQQKHRANLDIFAEGSVMQPGAQALYTMPNSPVKTLADLKGRTIGINAPDNILFLLAASVLSEHGISPGSVHFVTPQGGFPAMPGDLRNGTITAAVLPEPFASIAEQADGAVPLSDLNQGATESFPIEGYVVTKQWARKYPGTLAAFYRALEEGQQIADTNRSAVEAAMEALPKPLGLNHQTAAILDLDNYPVSTGPVGSVDKVRLQRVVDVMRQFIRFPAFNIGSMLMGAGGGI